MIKLPAPVLMEHSGIVVLRDDLLPGGSKRRALPCVLEASWLGDTPGEFVYASPVYGYAQIALAHAAREMNKRATIFCAARKDWHARTLEAEAAGARIIECSAGYMSVVRARAHAYCLEHGAKLLPFGLDTPEFVAALADVARALSVRPREVWCVAGSGTLSRALQIAWPKARHYAVRVGAAPETGNAQLLMAPEKFEQDAKLPPPFPSCSNYDAKAWRFIKAHASKGALFWNVAA